MTVVFTAVMLCLMLMHTIFSSYAIDIYNLSCSYVRNRHSDHHHSGNAYSCPCEEVIWNPETTPRGCNSFCNT